MEYRPNANGGYHEVAAVLAFRPDREELPSALPGPHDVDPRGVAHAEVDDAAGAEAGDRGAARERHSIHELAAPVDDVVFRAAARWLRRDDAHPQLPFRIGANGAVGEC